MNELNLKVSKLVGTTNHQSWAQNHTFIPDDKKKQQEYGSLFVSFSLKAAQEGIDLTSFGKEIISRLHEIYYSSGEREVLHRLKHSLHLLIKEFNEKVLIEAVVGVVIESPGQQIAYFALFGRGKVFIFRNHHLVELLPGQEEGIKSCSGFLKDNDLIILGTAQLFDIISLGILKASLESKDAESIVETLAPVVHGHPENSQTAAVIFKVEKTETQLASAQTTSASPVNINLKDRLQAFSANAGVFFNKLKEATAQRSLYLKDEQREKRAKRTTLTVALILAILLVVSIVLGTQKRSVSQETKTVDALMQEVSYKYEQAVPLEELNPLRARTMLTEARDLIKTNVVKVTNKTDKKKVEDLLTKIEQELEKVARDYKIDKPDIFLDLSLAKEEFKGSNWGIVDQEIYIFDQNKSTLLQVQADDKAYQIIAGGDKLASGKLVAATDNKAYILSKDKIITIDVVKTIMTGETKADDWGEIGDIKGFSGNVYLLDKNKGQVWKYSTGANGLASKTAYLKGKGTDLSSAVSLAIDGSVWVIFNDGTIEKFTRGASDNFVISGLDKPIDAEAKLFTNENLNNLYILDKKNLRIVVIAKDTGEYQAQYSWPGVAGVFDLAAFEDKNKILLLTGERIYQIDLKQ
jgi:hypothetical protein